MSSNTEAAVWGVTAPGSDRSRTRSALRSSRKALPAAVPRLGLLSLFILALPMTDVFSIDAWLPLPLIIIGGLQLCDFSRLPYRGFPNVSRKALYLWLILALGVIPYAWSSQYISSKAWHHLLAYIVIVSLYFCSVRGLLFRALFNPRAMMSISRCFLIASIVSSAYIVVEFILRNWLNTEISLYVPHLISTVEYSPLVLGRFIRPRGFGTEPAAMALYFELSTFLAIPAFRRLTTMSKVIVAPVLIVAFALLVSVAGIISLGVGLAIYIGMSLRRSIAAGVLIAAVVMTVGWVVYSCIPDYVDAYAQETFVPKLQSLLSGADDHYDVEHSRHSVYSMVAQIGTEYPFGIGIGIASSAADVNGEYHGRTIYPGQISLYGYFLVAAGWIGLAVFALFAITSLRDASRLEQYKYYLVPSGAALLVHFAVVADQWLPFIWFWAALVDALKASEFLALKSGRTA